MVWYCATIKSLSTPLDIVQNEQKGKISSFDGQSRFVEDGVSLFTLCLQSSRRALASAHNVRCGFPPYFAFSSVVFDDILTLTPFEVHSRR